VFIKPNDLKALRNDVWSEDTVPAILMIDGSQFSIELSYRGHLIRKNKKKSYHCLFKSPFLANEAHELHLNAEYNDPSLIRNKLSLDFFESIGVLAPHSSHIFLSFNGVPQGIYLKLESFDEFLLRKRCLPEGGIIYATNNDANFSLLTPEKEVKRSLLQGYTTKYNDQKAEERLSELILKINTLPNNEFFKEISKLIDIEKYLRWLAGVVCTNNFDGFIHNYALYLNSGTNLFEISPWDYDGTWGRDIHGGLLSHDYIPIQGYNTLTARILDYSVFRQMYRQILQRILNEHFTPEFLEPLIENLYKILDPYLSKDPFLKKRKDSFYKEPNIIFSFIKNRNKYLRTKLSILE
jgi:spore coat protein H